MCISIINSLLRTFFFSPKEQDFIAIIKEETNKDVYNVFLEGAFIPKFQKRSCTSNGEYSLGKKPPNQPVLPL